MNIWIILNCAIFVFVPIHTIQIYIIYRTIYAIYIRTDIVILLAEWIHPVPSCGDGVILPCTVVVGVQAVHLVKLLAVVLVRLDIAVGRTVAELRSERIIANLLDNISCLSAISLCYLADIS